MLALSLTPALLPILRRPPPPPGRHRLAAAVLIAACTVLRLGWAAALPPGNDEAYHWLYTAHPALSYFDHPPMTMWVATAGLAAGGGGVHPLPLRLGFVLLAAASTGVLFRWTERWFGGRAGFWAAAALSLSGYYSAFGGTLALPDSPFLFFALLTFTLAADAVAPDDPRGGRRLLPWLLVGLAFGGALLSKYHAVLLPAGVAAYLVVTPGKRRLLRTPGPYAAVLVGLALFSPVLAWNAQHEWASFRFQGGRAAGVGTPVLHEGPVRWLLGPALYLCPWVWVFLAAALARRVRRFGATGGVERLLVCLSAAPLLFFLAVSCLQRDVLPHWPLVGFLPLFPLVGRAWAGLRTTYPRGFAVTVASWAAYLLVAAAVVLAQARSGCVVTPSGVGDPAWEIGAWRSVAAELDARGLLDDPDGFLFTGRWYDSGQLAFALAERGRGRPVACYHTFDARGFAFWSRPGDYVGRTGHFVVVDEEDEAETRGGYAFAFARMAVAAEFAMGRGGRPCRRVKVYRCGPQLVPYPFDFAGRLE